MPRKPKQEKGRVTVVANGKAITVSLYPPSGSRTSWYAYWIGLSTSKSTGHSDYASAVLAVENMFRNGGQRSTVSDTIISDVEFEEIQRRHFSKKNDIAARARAEKSLYSCLNAIAAFRKITGISPVILATPDDCEEFQHEALRYLKNWRKDYPKGKKEKVECIRPNTVLKWSRSLQAAFQRANRTAGKRCVRGVVNESKLLTSNPWMEFTWIDGTEPTKRRFDNEELLSVLVYFETTWASIQVAASFVKVSLWTGARRSEVAGLRWENIRIVGDEHHLDFVGKWNVRRWARIPGVLYRELLTAKTGDPHVFAAYNEQLRQYHRSLCHVSVANNVGVEFSPEAFCEWFHKRLGDWSKQNGNGHATHHVFRKTALQGARRGEDRNDRVAQDARVSRSVMMRHYVDETEEELWQASNRHYHRILAGLTPELARRYGDEEAVAGSPEQELRGAVEAKDWAKAKQIVERLSDAGDEQKIPS
jgi:integrase